MSFMLGVKIDEKTFDKTRYCFHLPAHGSTKGVVK